VEGYGRRCKGQPAHEDTEHSKGAESRQCVWGEGGGGGRRTQQCTPALVLTGRPVNSKYLDRASLAVCRVWWGDALLAMETVAELAYWAKEVGTATRPDTMVPADTRMRRKSTPTAFW
jgi:hypothetical protein